MLKHKGEYESVDAVLFGSSLLGFDFHLIYMSLCQKWTINKTTSVDLSDNNYFGVPQEQYSISAYEK